MQKKQLTPLYKYKSFGLNIQSILELPELENADFNKPDVTIRYGRNPVELDDIKGKGILYQAKKNDFLFKLNTVGSYRVEDGNSITIERLSDSSDDEIRLFLLGSAFGALIHQRELIPFHGSAVVKDDKAYILGGLSGVGKSSLAAVLIKRGYQLLADDISVININGNIPIVYPGIPHLKLWHDIMEELNEDIDSYSKIRPQLHKYRKPINNQFINKVTSLEKIIILNSKNTPGFEFSEIKGGDKFNVLRANTYRHQYINGLEITSNHFNLTVKIAASTKVYTLKRPSTPLLLQELSDYIINEVITIN